MPGTKKSETDNSDRKRIRTLRRDAGWTYQQIAHQVGRSKAAVWQICNAPETPKKPRSGRPPLLDTPKRKAFVELARTNAEYRRKACPDLARELDFTTEMSALTTAFKKEGYGRRRAREKPFLTEKAKLIRKKWCEEQQDWTVEKWRKVMFSDECFIAAGGKRGKVFVTHMPGEEYLEDCLVPKFSHYSAVMVWGAIRGGQKSPLVVWDKKNWGSIDAVTYCNNLLYPVFFPFWLQQSQLPEINKPVLFMEDGALPGHRAAYTQKERGKPYPTQYKVLTYYCTFNSTPLVLLTYTLNPMACFLARLKPDRKCGKIIKDAIVARKPLPT